MRYLSQTILFNIDNGWHYTHFGICLRVFSSGSDFDCSFGWWSVSHLDDISPSQLLRKLNSGWNIGNCEVFFFSIGSLSGTDCGNIMQWGNISILNAKTSTSTFSRVYYFSCRSFPNVFDIALSSTVAYLVMQKNSGRISFSALHHRPSHHFSQYQTRCTILDYRKIPVCFQFQQTFERNLHFAETLPEFCKSSTHCQL